VEDILQKAFFRHALAEQANLKYIRFELCLKSELYK